MSSSDSEDDCYGNVVKTLNSLKNNFKEDRLESAKLLNNCVNANQNENTNNQNTATTTDLNDTISDDDEIDKLIALHSKRATRASTRSKRNTNLSCSTNATQTTTQGRGRGRGRGKKRQLEKSSSICPTAANSCAMTSSTCRTLISRGRSSSRQAARSGRRSRSNILDASIQTFAIGNCDEYDDLSNNVQLFSKSNEANNPTDVQVVENDIFDENEELSVKVIWQSVDIVKFTIRKYQKISQIFEYFSDKTKSSINNLLFIYNEKILKPDDTPDSFNYNIAKFIDGGIVSTPVSLYSSPNTEPTSKPPGGIKLKFQYPNTKKAFEIYVTEDEPLSVSMMKCAEHMEVPIKRLKFEFDGDCITGHDTAKGLDMEGGECIDVKIIS